MSVIYTSTMIVDGHTYSYTYGSNGALASQICVDPYNPPSNPDLAAERALVNSLIALNSSSGNPTLVTIGQAVGFILKRLIQGT